MDNTKRNKILMYIWIWVIVLFLLGTLTYIINWSNSSDTNTWSLTTQTNTWNTMWTPPGWFASGAATPPPWTWTSNANVEIKASSKWLWVSWESKTISSWNYSSTTSDESAIAVTNSWTLTISNLTVTKSWDVSNTENSEFYWLNSWIIAKWGSTINISDTSVTTTANWANGIFSTSNSTINISNVIVKTTAETWARWLDATYGWTINADNVTISTVWAHSAAIATDRWEWTINISNSKLETSWTDSPAIYSTWKFSVKNTTWTANNAESAVIEWQNSISLVDSILTATKNWGVLIYQSFSWDADWVWWIFTMEWWSLTVNDWPVFYSTNTTWYINLKNVKITSTSWVLLNAEANSRWGTTWLNWANVVLNADTQTLTWDINVDSISTADIKLTNNSILTWKINSSQTAKSVNLSLDSTSILNLTRDSYVNTISANISWTAVTNIKWNWYTIYYKSSENSSLWWKTYTLVNWWYLKAY